MRRLPTVAPMALVCFIIAGCTNSIYFYETEKISLTAEGRPDPSAPASFNLGIKQRVVAVVPPKRMQPSNSSATSGTVPPTDQPGAAAAGQQTVSEIWTPASDAMSLISVFDFRKSPGKNHPITIEMALLTGRAALAVKQGQAATVLDSFVETSRFGSPEQVRLQELLDQLEGLAVRDPAKADGVRDAVANDLGGTFKARYDELLGRQVAKRAAFLDAIDRFLGHQEMIEAKGPNTTKLIEALQTHLD